MDFTPLTWIIIAAVVIVVIVALLILLGLRRRKSREISFTKKEEIEQQKPSSGHYEAKGGFSFTSGGGMPGGAPDARVKEPVTRPGAGPVPGADAAPASSADTGTPAGAAGGRTEQPSTQAPAAGGAGAAGKAGSAGKPEQTTKAEPAEKAGKPEPATKTEPAEKTGKAEPAEKTEPAEKAGKAEPAKKTEQTTKTEPAEKAGKAEPAGKAETAEPSEKAEKPQKAEPTPKAEATQKAEPAEKAEQPEQPGTTGTAPAAPAAPSAPAAPAAPAELAAPAEPEPAPAVDRTEDIAPVDGRLGRLRGRMAKSQNVIGKGVLGILGAGDLDEDAWEEIEDTLIMADLGTKTTLAVVEDLRERIAATSISTEEEARALLRQALITACRPELDRSIKAMPYDGKPAVIMVVGVNGTGKTTTTGKLSRVLVGMGHSVVLGAADTFRAAAADQLETWGRRVGAETVRGKEGADPASVAFDAVARGVDDGVDVVVVDTAGRLHTAVGLMDQLGKVKRVVEKKAKVDEVLLVLDATVGQNGLIQARTFRDVVDISGVVLTKLDGTAKGGIVFQVQEELGVPVKLVGLGEGADDLAPFEVESFVDALLG
ncbi:signal recognition particle-docking protein FtsY [Corynebacterium bovis]|uniref:signal recognition particle-docking protein FtsY n=5 Tax=Corynebacterium bovis TaxID=36808 RepID=UPI000F64E39D|nr:signal recognition particle-docking protein FtsY [Corynebacterium bovis]RRQ14390.1 signal recognition particle-docking protein FtsY [Corynebacterium bovis]